MIPIYIRHLIHDRLVAGSPVETVIEVKAGHL